MKKIFTIVTIFAFHGVFAQSIMSIDPVSVVTKTLEEVGPNGELGAEWHVQNVSDQTVSVRARRNVISAVAGSTNYFCWNLCFTEGVTVSPASLAVTMTPGEVNTSFFAHYRPNNNLGDTFIEYCFFNAADQTDESCHLVQYSVVAEVAVSESEEVALQLSELSPNPLNGIGTLQYSFKTAPTQAQLVIRNMVGQVVKQTNISGQNGFLLINSEDFKSGVYLYSIVADGKVMTTKRMIVN